MPFIYEIDTEAMDKYGQNTSSCFLFFRMIVLLYKKEVW